MGVIAKQSIRGTIVTYLGVGIGFLTTFFVLTRFLTTEEIGLARVLIDTSTLFIGLAGLGTSSSIIRFYPYFREKGAFSGGSSNGFFFWTVAFPFVGFLLFMLLYWGAHVPLQAIFVEKSPLFVDYYYAVLPISFFMLYQTVFENNANVLMRIVWPRAVREVVLRLILLLAYLLYAFRIISLDGMVIGICLSYGLACLCNIVYLIAFGHISFRPNWQFVDRSLARKFLFYTLFQITAAIATAITPLLSSFFISAQMGLSFTGIYAIATYMASMVSIPNRSLNAIANPQLATATKEGDQQALTTLFRQVSNNSLLVGGLILTIIWVNIELIFHLLPNGDTYAVARMVVLILGLSQLLMATFNASLSVLNYSRYYYLSLVYSFILTILSILLNNYLIPLYGMNGAALANLLSYAIYFGVVCITMPICCHTSPFSRPQLKTLFLLSLLTAACYLFDLRTPSMNVWVTSLIKTTMWGTTALTAYAWQISPEINSYVKKFLHR